MTENHDRVVREVNEALRGQGYRIITLPSKPDSIAVRDGKVYAVEILKRNGGSRSILNSKNYNDFDDTILQLFDSERCGEPFFVSSNHFFASSNNNHNINIGLISIRVRDEDMIETQKEASAVVPMTTGITESGEARFLTLRVGTLSPTWANYGLTETPLLLSKGGAFEPSKYKLILKGKQNKPEINSELIAILSKEYELFPNEELAKVMDRWATENGFKRKEDSRYTYMGSHGNAQFLTYLPRDEKDGSYYIGDRKDQVRLGFCARNSIDGSVGFGLDVFTFRGLCWNGAIVMTREGSRAFNQYQIAEKADAKLHHKHTSGLQEIVKNLDRYVAELHEVGEGVIAYYRHLATQRFNREIAEALNKTILPKKYLEHNGTMTFEDKKQKKTLVSIDSKADMWTVYNSLSEAIWHQTSTDMRSKFQYFGVTHDVLAQTVPAPRRA